MSKPSKLKERVALRPLPLSDWDKSLAHVIEDMGGLPLNIHSLMAHNPRLLDAWWSFRNHCVSGGALGVRKAELVVLRVAVKIQAWYEWASHVDRSMAAGLTLDEIRHVQAEGLHSGWAADERVLLEAVDELIADHQLSGETLDKLSKYFSPDQAMDVIAIHGAYVTLGCLLNTWDLELDQHVERSLPIEISRVAFAKVERAQEEQKDIGD